jgi:hypothetical protein
LPEGTWWTDFDEWNFENVRAEFAELGGQRAGLMTGSANEDADALERFVFTLAVMLPAGEDARRSTGLS